MSTNDDAVIAALYGKNYGPAHKDQLPGDESARSAMDPGRRLGVEDQSAHAGYAPSRSVFGPSVDQALGVKPGVAGLSPADEPDLQDYVEDATDPLASIVETEMSDGWRDTVAAYAASHDGFTSDQVLIDAFDMVPEFIERSDQMRVAEILRELGYERQQKRVNGERQNLWIKLS